MAEKFFLAYDVGTTYLKTAILDENFNLVAKATKSYPLHTPKRGYVEQDPDDWWRAVIDTTREVLEESNVVVDKIKAIIFSSMMSTLVAINRDGEPLFRAMTWLDTRAAETARKYFGSGLIKFAGYNLFTVLRFLRITGGAPGFAGKDNITRILWIKDNWPDIYKDVYKFLDSRDYLVFKATGNAVTSRDVAHLWWIMDTRPNVMDWSETLLKKYGIEREKLPEIKLSIDIAGNLRGEAAKELGLREGIPVVVGAGDISTVAVGSGAVRDGEFHLYIGTSDWIAAHSRDRKLDVSHYIGSLASAIPDKYLCIAEQETAGACLDWVKDNMFKSEAEELGEKVYDLFDELVSKIPPGSEGLFFTPWLSGERAPLDDDTVRGGFHNMGLEHTREHALRAVMEGVAYNIYWILGYMEKLFKPVEWINFVGGGALRETWSQIVADVTGKIIRRMVLPREVGVRGAAMIGAVALGVYKSFEEAAERIAVEKIFKPNEDNHRFYRKMFEEFKKIYKQNKGIYRRLNRERLKL